MNQLINLQGQTLATIDNGNILNLSDQVLATYGNGAVERDGTVLIRWEGDTIMTRLGVTIGHLSGLEIKNCQGQTLATVGSDSPDAVALAAAFMFFFAGTT